jgi:hypothetical protein
MYIAAFSPHWPVSELETSKRVQLTLGRLRSAEPRLGEPWNSFPVLVFRLVEFVGAWRVRLGPGDDSPERGASLLVPFRRV